MTWRILLTKCHVIKRKVIVLRKCSFGSFGFESLSQHKIQVWNNRIDSAYEVLHVFRILTRLIYQLLAASTGFWPKGLIYRYFDENILFSLFHDVNVKS